MWQKHPVYNEHHNRYGYHYLILKPFNQTTHRKNNYKCQYKNSYLKCLDAKIKKLVGINKMKMYE